MSNSENNLRAGGRDKWGLEGHLALLLGLNAILDKEKIKPSTHKDLVLEAFECKGGLLETLALSYQRIMA
jgi:hypothetical protein